MSLIVLAAEIRLTGEETMGPVGITCSIRRAQNKEENRREEERLERLRTTKAKPYDEVANIMAYEQGELSSADTLILFAVLVKNGLVWSLQGSYGRAATALIGRGYLDRSGNILKGFDED
jgi:hypothetical protein